MDSHKGEHSGCAHGHLGHEKLDLLYIGIVYFYSIHTRYTDILITKQTSEHRQVSGSVTYIGYYIRSTYMPSVSCIEYIYTALVYSLLVTNM